MELKIENLNEDNSNKDREIRRLKQLGNELVVVLQRMDEHRDLSKSPT